MDQAYAQSTSLQSKSSQSKSLQSRQITKHTSALCVRAHENETARLGSYSPGNTPQEPLKVLKEKWRRNSMQS